MPFRKNLGFNEEASGWNGRRRASPWVEYSVGLHFVRVTRSGPYRQEALACRMVRRAGRPVRDDAEVKIKGIGSGGRIRTTDQGLMSPLLYH
jgi:hypothetical protein